jgi:betaine-aldehyde dehydrogenase
VAKTISNSVRYLSGQVCYMTTRLIADRKRQDALAEALRESFGGLTVGDPFDPASEMGPVVSGRQRAHRGLPRAGTGRRGPPGDRRGPPGRPGPRLLRRADADRAYAVARRLRTGTVGHNGVRTDATIAFGGFKRSGIGREGGAEGLRPSLESKTVLLDELPRRLA